MLLLIPPLHPSIPFHCLQVSTPAPLLAMLLFTASAAVQPICKPIPHTSPLCHISWSATTTNCWSVCPKPDIIFPHHPTTPPLVLSSIPDQYNLAPSTWGRRLGSYWHLGWCQRWGCVQWLQEEACDQEHRTQTAYPHVPTVNIGGWYSGQPKVTNIKYFMWLKWHILTSKWRPLFGIVYKLIVLCEHSGTVIKVVFDVIVCFSSAWGFRPSVYHTIWELVEHHSTAASLSWQVQGLWKWLTFRYLFLT